VIRKVTNSVRQEEQRGNKNLYTVLMILTDGIITDMPQTIDAIVDASDTALSIVIVGVGNADFSNMETLDGDDVKLRHSSGRYGKRDIVQFVPFRDFQMSSSPERLASTVLAELPKQLVKYFKIKNLPPLVMTRPQ